MKPLQTRSFGQSVSDAIQGIKFAIVSQRNMKLHVLAMAGALATAYGLALSPQEWAMLVLCITAVMTAEMLNTAIEKAVDLVTEEYHPLAKHAKDVAAGAVLCSAVGALIVGGIIFLPKLLSQ